MNRKAKYYISKLHLIPHPEGGYFRETYRSDEFYKARSLPKRYNKNRVFSTCIYFLLEGSQISYFHRLKSDELWHYYDGCGVKIYMLEENGKLFKILLGKNFSKGEVFQITIKKNCWFAAEVSRKDSFCLFGCTVSPGFDFEDFELANGNNLVNRYPEHKEIIKKMTKFTA